MFICEKMLVTHIGEPSLKDRRWGQMSANQDRVASVFLIGPNATLSRPLRYLRSTGGGRRDAFRAFYR